MLYEPSLGQQVDAVTIGAPIERDRQIELGRVDTECRAGDRHALRIAAELEFGGGRPQLVEREVAVAENVDLPVLDPSVHAARHLEDLVRP